MSNVFTRTINGARVIGELTYLHVSFQVAETLIDSWTTVGMLVDSRQLEWRAAVVRGDSGSYILWIQTGELQQMSGSFENVKAVVKYIREKGKEKFLGRAATIDTLDRLSGRKLGVVTPTCFGSDAYNESADICIACTYKALCRDVVFEPSPQSVESESDDDFLARLHGKVAAKKWEQ